MKAFPSIHYDQEIISKNGNKIIPVSFGMDLRDYFAAKAMQGFCANISRDLSLNIGHFANLSYKVADQMMEVRNASI
jgi:hypothetical protein